VKELTVTTEQDAAAGWVGPTASLGMLEMTKVYCSCQDLNAGLSSSQSSH